MGAGHVALVVHWSQKDVRSVDIAPDPAETVPDCAVAAALTEARRQGLEVFLFPIVSVRERTLGEWRGTLRPARWDRWFEAHERFLLHYARLAERHGAALFAVGSELLSTEGRRADWSRTIARVRESYRGKVVYSANWDHYRMVTFWDLVDYVGVNGYYEVAKPGGASVEAMTREWGRIRARLEDFARRVGKPLLITEVGYPSVRGGARWPWHYGRQAEVDVDEQARAYRAFIETWQGARSLEGVFFWNWLGPGGSGDPHYTPRGKPAARLLRAWFTGGR
jgi:hypothetical protein